MKKIEEKPPGIFKGKNAHQSKHLVFQDAQHFVKEKFRFLTCAKLHTHIPYFDQH
jgi:hypothetical protein